MALDLPVGNNLGFDRRWIEQIILQLGDTFEIRIAWNYETALATGVCALAGALVGNYAGGKIGAAVGAGIGGVVGVSTMVPLRELWTKVKEQLQELVYIVFNYLRQLDPIDYCHALNMLLASSSNKNELLFTILEFIAAKLGRRVISNMIM